jgi:hypothetical protein
MGDFRTHNRSFGGGEMTPEFFGMIADPKFQTGLAKCRNFLVKPHGPVENRPGTEFVREVKNSNNLTRTIPFVYGFGQSLVIEFSVGVFRFHAEGATILSGGSPYEVAHTYTVDELFEVTYAQSGDIVKLAHRNHPRRELRRTSATSWSLVALTVGPELAAPTGTGGSATPGTTPGTPYNTDYVVTAVTIEGDESLQSATVTISNNLYDDGAYNTITWSARTGAERYNVYKKQNGLFGYIGQTTALTFRDENIAPDLGTTPPLDIQLFDAADDYPGAVAYQDQRAVWAGTNNEPQNVWMTQAGSEDNFNYSIPAKDADSIQFKIASRENNAILHLVPMADLIACTPAALWRISGGSSDVITPTSLLAREQTFVGSAQVKPIKVGNNLIYVASRGGHLREFGFDGDRNGYISGDVSIRAPHLFDTSTIRSMTLQQAPYPVIWAVTTSGLLIGLTYIPEQQIAAFHWHDTQGYFEDATTIYEQGRDVTYVVVRRVINGVTKRFIERFADRAFAEQADQYFVDCGYTYRGGATNSVSGLTWLANQEVSILADGAVVAPQTVSAGGVLTLPNDIEAQVITVGLGYESDLQSLPMSIETQGYGQGMPKNINDATLRVYRSAGIFVGPTFEELTEAKLRTNEPLGTPTDLKTGTVEVVLEPGWDSDGQFCVRQADPVALTILSMTLDVALGGG